MGGGRTPGRAGWRRLDQELVEQGLFPDQGSALRAVMAGMVSCEGRRLEHAGEKVAPGAPLHVRGRRRYVSRGGHKLAGALDAFGIDASGLRCLDVGCSTGGFTDCLLQAGASSVCAVDVGRAQFDWGLRNDARVRLFESTNICDADPGVLGAPFDLAVADVSFTSVERILPAVRGLLDPARGQLCSLVKPQFECARDQVGAGGVVRDPAVHEQVLLQVAEAFSGSRLSVAGMCASPVRGAKGNIEYFLWAAMGAPAGQVDVQAVVDGAWHKEGVRP